MKKVSAPAAFTEETFLGPLPQEDEASFSGSALRRVRVVHVAIAFVVFVCGALLAMNAWMIVRARAAEYEQIAQANTNLAQAVGQQIEGLVGMTEHIVSGIVFELERSDVTPESLQRMQPALVNHVTQIEYIKGIFIFGADGRWLVHSTATAGVFENIADRAYFNHHQENPSAQTLISDPVISRSSGEWVIPVSRRFNDSNGNFAGVVVATLSIKYLVAFLERFQIGQLGAITLFRDGRILVRRPFNVGDLGRPNIASRLLKLSQASRSGTTLGASAIDGVTRILSFEHLANYPLLVTVAVGEDEALGEWRTSSVYQTIWVVLLSMVIAAMGVRLIRSMRRQMNAEHKLHIARDALTEANERLASLAKDDSLTGLANRRYFDARLARCFAAAQKTGSPLAIVMIDVDEFKKYNDQYGHLQGDACLQQVANALRSVLHRSTDFIARYGGEEVVLLLPDTDASSAASIAESARVAVMDLHIRHEVTASGIVSVSLGVAAWTPHSDDAPCDLLAAADAMLYQAKDLGRDRVCLFHASKASRLVSMLLPSKEES